MVLVKNRLSAGFFSNLNAVIGWYWYSLRTDVPVFIQWSGSPETNIFNQIFSQKYKYKSPEYENEAFIQHSPLFTGQIKNAFKEDVGDSIFTTYDGWFLCQGGVYTDPGFYRVRQLYNYIYSECLTVHPTIIPPSPITTKTLGVNYRFIDMYSTLDHIPFKDVMSLEEYNNRYLQQIEQVFDTGGFDKIYLTSSQKIFFDICLDKFKDRLLYLPMERLEEGLWQQYRNVPLIKEYIDVLIDVINLTKCDHLLISPSNMAFGALYINPTITYEVLDFLKATQTL